RMASRACRVASVISAVTVAWRAGLFHSTVMSKTWNSRALSFGGRRGGVVPGTGRPGRRAGVAGGPGGFGPGLWSGLQPFAFGVQLGEPGADPGAVGLGGGVVRVGGKVFEFEDLGVLRGLDPGDPGLDCVLLGLAVGGGSGVGGGELGGEQRGASGSEHA